MDGWMDGWVGGWLENEFLKKTPSPKLDLSPCLGLSTLEFVKMTNKNSGLTFFCCPNFLRTKN